MTRCLDIHTHHPAPQPQAVVNVSPTDFSPAGRQLYSVGIHPWTTVEEPSETLWEQLDKAAHHPQVVAIGECGIDLLKGGPLFRQLLVLKRQIELSESIGKPLIIHAVKADDIIMGLKRDMNPKQKWAIHGFRGKPQAAAQLSKAGIWLSFGERFNPEAPKVVPNDMLLAETDESQLTIEDIINNLSAATGHPLKDEIAVNTCNFLNLGAVDFSNGTTENDIS